MSTPHRSHIRLCPSVEVAIGERGGCVLNKIKLHPAVFHDDIHYGRWVWDVVDAILWFLITASASRCGDGGGTQSAALKHQLLTMINDCHL